MKLLYMLENCSTLDDELTVQQTVVRSNRDYYGFQAPPVVVITWWYPVRPFGQALKLDLLARRIVNANNKIALVSYRKCYK